MAHIITKLIWFREDLRIHDNTALYHATKELDAHVVGIYIIDTSFWRKHDIAACRVEFICSGLKQLSQDLHKLNIPLLIISVADTSIIPRTLFDVIHRLNGKALFFNRQYEVDECRRDAAVTNYLIKENIPVYDYDDQVILEPNSVLTQQGTYFKVFTPYKRAWQRLFQHRAIFTLLPAPKVQPPISLPTTPPPQQIDGFSSSVDMNLWPAGEKMANTTLQIFIEKKLAQYDTQRNFPALAGTSKLSPYLATGMISPRQCFLAAFNANNQQLEGGNKGTTVWMSELIWREFYKHLLVAVPRVSMGKAYQLRTEKIPWRHDDAHLIAWQQGKTGYPIIDAAMRQLNTIGWMHNRLRMIAAMFLTKNLLLDWRLGERYFMQHLIDGDLAANNGGWQWCASTGVDAAPYFRIFNPIKQSERFDPTGLFIREYCPELSKFNAKKIHDPSTRAPTLLKKCNYPTNIIDLEESRKRFIDHFRKYAISH